MKLAWVRAIQDTLDDHLGRRETFERGRSFTKDGSGRGSGGGVGGGECVAHRGSGQPAFAWQHHRDESPERDAEMGGRVTSEHRTAKPTRHHITTVF